MPYSIGGDAPRQVLEVERRMVREIPRVQKQAARAGARAAGRIVRNRSREIVPVKTGALRDSIRVTSRLGAVVVLAGGEGARHAHLIERGTERAPAKPFMVPASEQTAAEQSRANERVQLRFFERLDKRRALTGAVPSGV